MNKNNQPIGIFDSGVGGLTVLKKLSKILPNEEFIYFGDTAHVPYGNKSKKTIIRYCQKIVEFLESKKVKLIVVACNTASSTALEILQKQNRVRFIDVIKPCIKKATEITQNNKICIIGTKTTIDSQKYQKDIKKINKDIKIFPQACPLLVPIIEEAFFNNTITKEAIKIYLSNIEPIFDTLILGCTHYPLIKNIIAQNLKKDVKIVDSSIETAKYVEIYLTKNNLLSTKKGIKSNKFYVSDDPQKFNKVAKKLLNENLNNIMSINLK